MSTYAARVKIPKRVGDPEIFSWAMDELLVDAIVASSERKAKKLALVEASSFLADMFPDQNQRARLPYPDLVAISRINKEGKPVKSGFSTKANIYTAIDKDAEPIAKVDIKPVTPAPFKAGVKLDDPFTEALIATAIGEKKS